MSVEPIALTRRQLREMERAQEATLTAVAAPEIVLPPIPEEDIVPPILSGFILPPIPEDEEPDEYEHALPAPVPALSVLPPRPDLDKVKAWVRRMSVNRNVVREVPDDFFFKKNHSMADYYGPFPVPSPTLVDFRLPWALSATLGALGIDRFFLKRYKTGALKLMTLGGGGIWWAADMFSLATGTAVDGAGHPLQGTRGQRALAVGASVVLAACAAWVVLPATGTTAHAAATVISEAKDAVQRITAPKAEPLSWAPVGQFTGDPKANPSQTITLTGEAVRISYSMTDAGILYLVPLGTDIVAEGATPVVASDAKGQGVTELPVAPGEYQFILQSQGAYWMARVEELRAAER